MSKEERPILEAKHVTKKFPLANGKELIANDDISLKFYKGHTLGIVGESGCGKSTFMRMMVQLEKPTSGKIFFKEKDITKMKGEELRANRRNVQMVFQNPATSFNPKMKVRDIICEPLMNFGLIKKKEKDAIARKYLEMVELPGDFVDRYPHNMSGGQQQRVALARILASEPQMLLLDEPFSALDSFLKEQLLEDMIRQLSDYAGDVIMVSHSRDEIYQFCDRLLILDQGRVIVTGDTKDIFDQPGYREAARLTGCKNITEAIKIAENSIEVPHWHCTLEVDETVADDIHAVGIRAHYIDVLTEKPENMKNVIGVTVENVSELPFEWYCFFRVPNGERIWWKVAKVGEHGAAKYLPQKGAHVYLHMPPQSIILLK